MRHEELPPERFAAIVRGIKLGETLIDEHPEIANLYRGGNTVPSIVEDLNIQSMYGVTNINVAWTGVRCAISGHEGGFNLSPYSGLIPDVMERKRIAEEHKRESGRKKGLELYESGEGIHAQTLEERRELCRRGGCKTYEEGLGVHGRTAEQMSELGHRLYREGLGIHGRTAEQKREDRLKSTLARGQTPWVTEGIPEIERAYALTFLPEFQRSSSNNNQLIALELNGEYHDGKEVRTVKAVKRALSKYKKSLEDKV